MSSGVWLPVSIALGSFISEDAAVAAATSLAMGKLLGSDVAFASCFIGIWTGDLGLYWLARKYRANAGRNWLARFVESRARRAESWFERHGVGTLLASRFVPGSRLATLLAAGVARMPVSTFMLTTAAGAALWIAAAFALAKRVPTPASWSVQHRALAVVASVITAVVLGRLAERAVPALRHRAGLIARWAQRWRRWEFWPAWLFYAPVAAMCAWLAIKYRGLSLPTAANPSQRNGGVVGESKAEILAAIAARWPQFVAEAAEIGPGDAGSRSAELVAAMRKYELQFPVVLKPNVGQRGAGFRIVRTLADATAYFRRVAAPVLLQRYAAGRHEAGIFYYRFPGEERGHILAITEKQFPTVIGDGRSTLAELIERDSRARLIAGVYLARFESEAQRVLARGEHFRLVEAGNHCQGCIFADGGHLLSDVLSQRIDQISRSLPGFYIGRYDVRYENDEALRQGEFTIIELNGAASEATSIYDARNTLWSAYGMLYRQWELVYAIGAANRARGAAPAGVAAIWRDWLAYRRMALSYPPAD